MDPRLLKAYNDELAYLRESAREFGEEHEAVAGRLGLKTPTDPDPYVERLLEGVAFLSARVQLKQQDQYPEFTQHLLQAVQPHYLAPMPSIAIASFEPKPGALRSDRPNDDLEFYACLSVCESASVEMGLGAGGRMHQSIYPDRYGIETWDVGRQHSIHVHIANSVVWRETTGEEPPPTPVSTQSYIEAGLPWFELYDEHLGDLAPSPELARVRSIDQV